MEKNRKDNKFKCRRCGEEFLTAPNGSYIQCAYRKGEIIVTDLIACARCWRGMSSNPVESTTNADLVYDALIIM